MICMIIHSNNIYYYQYYGYIYIYIERERESYYAILYYAIAYYKTMGAPSIDGARLSSAIVYFILGWLRLV